MHKKITQNYYIWTTGDDELKTRRLNLMIQEPLLKWSLNIAKARGVTVSEFVRQALQHECAVAEDGAIEKAAAELAPRYETDDELTAFRSLDAEDML
jgi:hypothetical protein